MTPMEDDPSFLEAPMRFLKSCFEWFASFSGLAVPALVGASIGEFRDKRRKSAKRKLVCSILMSAAVGCGLTPLFAHIFGIPDPVASSLSFFLGVWGLEGVDVVQDWFRSKV